MTDPDASRLTDEPELLRSMLAEQAASHPRFHTTNYWKNYERRLLPYLESHGLRGFRSGNYARGGEVLHSFGASDRALERRPPLAARAIEKLLRRAGLVSQAAAFRRRVASLDPQELEAQQNRLVATAEAFERGAGAIPLAALDVSRVGEPASAFSYNGKTLTPAALGYYMRYAYVSRRVDFRELKLVVELSSGAGKQAEVLAKLHPHLTLVLFDIPPQLYIAHQYLSAVLPDRVVRFDPQAHLDPDHAFIPGKIHLMGNWQIDLLRGRSVDLFWSAASLGEMEPDIAQYYLDIANGCAAHVYLMQKMDGKEVAPRAGAHGVLSKVTLEQYRTALADFELLDRQPARMPDGGLPGAGYEDSFWSRRSAPAGTPR